MSRSRSQTRPPPPPPQPTPRDEHGLTYAEFMAKRDIFVGAEALLGSVSSAHGDDALADGAAFVNHLAEQRRMEQEKVAEAETAQAETAAMAAAEVETRAAARAEAARQRGAFRNDVLARAAAMRRTGRAFERRSKTRGGKRVAAAASVAAVVAVEEVAVASSNPLLAGMDFEQA